MTFLPWTWSVVRELTSSIFGSCSSTCVVGYLLFDGLTYVLPPFFSHSRSNSFSRISAPRLRVSPGRNSVTLLTWNQTLKGPLKGAMSTTKKPLMGPRRNKGVAGRSGRKSVSLTRGVIDMPSRQTTDFSCISPPDIWLLAPSLLEKTIEKFEAYVSEPKLSY